MAWAAIRTRWCARACAPSNWRNRAATSSSRRWAITAEAGTAFLQGRPAEPVLELVVEAVARLPPQLQQRRLRRRLPHRLGRLMPTRQAPGPRAGPALEAAEAGVAARAPAAGLP